MSSMKIGMFAAVAAVVAEAAIVFLLYEHVGGEMPPDLLGWIGVCLSFPGILLAFYAGRPGLVLAALVVFLQYFLIFRFLFRRRYGHKAEPFAPGNSRHAGQLNGS